MKSYTRSFTINGSLSRRSRRDFRSNVQHVDKIRAIGDAYNPMRLTSFAKPLFHG